MIRSIMRILLEKDLLPVLRSLNGTVYDVGAGAQPYRKSLRATKYIDFDLKDAKVLCDITDEKSIPPNYWGKADAVLAIEVLEHVNKPQEAVTNLRRMLKKGGRCILSTRFLYKYHPCPRDYYRFTRDSLQWLFRDFESVRIIPHGNAVLSIWQIITTCRNYYLRNALKKFNPLFKYINYRDEDHPLGFLVIAEK